MSVCRKFSNSLLHSKIYKYNYLCSLLKINFIFGFQLIRPSLLSKTILNNFGIEPEAVINRI